MRSISETGRKALEQLEAPGGKACLKVYKDGAGRWTNGFGHTKGVTANTPDITPQQADANLMLDLMAAEQAVSDGVKVEINQCQFDALVIFTFNVGVGDAAKGTGFLGSTLLKELNKGNFAAVPIQLARWNKITDPKTGKKVVDNGLVNRRAAEIAMFTRALPPVVTADTVIPDVRDVPAIASPPQPIAPAASVATTKTGATVLGTLATGGGAAVIQGVTNAQQYKAAFDNVLGGVASGKQWYTVLVVVLVAIAVCFSVWTFLHKARSMKS